MFSCSERTTSGYKCLKTYLCILRPRPKNLNMSANPTKNPAIWLMIFIPIMWYKSQFFNDSSTIDIQLHSTYYVIAGSHIMFVFLLYLTICAAVYWKHQGRRLTPWMTLVHLVVSIIFCTYFLDVALTDVGVPRRYYSGPPPLPLLWYETAPGKILLFIGAFLLAQVIFIINIWRARRIQG